MHKKITIIDYKLGNVSAISNMLSRIGEKPEITDNHDKIDNSDFIILPGVGSFDRAIKNLEDKDLLSILNKKISDNTKILGICLGMQILCNGSEEGTKRGFGVFDVECKSFETKNSSKIFIGWSDIKIIEQINDFRFMNNNKFYFLHKYYFPINKDYTIGISDNDLNFSSFVKKNNIFGVQFHPEKSHNYGINFFKNFLNLK